MPRKPKGIPLTAEQIDEVVQEKRNSKIYKAESMELSREAISESVSKALAQIRKADSRGRFNLEDTATVKQITENYLASCATNATFPSMDGVALCLGYTRKGLYNFMTKRPDSETGKFLTQVHDTIAQVLSENALKGNANNITAIFLLKALYGYRDSQTIELVTGDSYKDEPSTDDILNRAGLLD